MLITGYDMVNSGRPIQDQITVLRKPFERAAFLREVHALLASSAELGNHMS